MKFWQIVAALLMWKFLEIAWTYSIILGGGEFNSLVFLAVTIAWALVSVVIWEICQGLSKLLTRYRAAVSRNDAE